MKNQILGKYCNGCGAPLISCVCIRKINTVKKNTEEAILLKKVLKNLHNANAGRKYTKEDIIQILSDYIFDQMNVDEPENVNGMIKESEKEAKEWFDENVK